MLTSADKVGGWGQKPQNHADVILEWSLRMHIVVPKKPPGSNPGSLQVLEVLGFSFCDIIDGPHYT